MPSIETQAEGLRRRLRVVIPAAELTAEIEAKVREIAPQVQRPGFRKGKVPASLVRQLHGGDLLRDFIREQMQKSAETALGEARLASEPRYELEGDFAAVEKGEADLNIKIEVDLLPEFEPADPAGISLIKPVAEPTAEKIDQTLQDIAAANRTYADKGGPAAEGDRLRIDFIGRIDGEAFEGGAAEGAELEIGAGRFIPGFEEQLTGAAAGDNRTIEVTFPEDYPVATLKGRPASFEVTVHAVLAPQAPSVDDALAQQMGLDDLAALRERVKARIAQDYAALSRAKAKRALFDALDKAHTFELPQSMVEAEFAQIWAQVEADIKADRLDEDDKAKSEDELKAEYRRIAERRVRLGLVLAEVGRRNEITVPEEQVRTALIEEARRYPGAERQVVEFYQKNPQAMAQLRAPLYEDRVVDFMLELAQVTTKDVPLEELMKDEPFA